MTRAARITIARAIADDLDRLEPQLAELLADADEAGLHRAGIRLRRLHECAKSTAHGLRIQARKLGGHNARAD